MAATGSNWECLGSGPDVNCQWHLLNEVVGFSQLDGKQWGGITKDDFIAGYVCSLPTRFLLPFALFSPLSSA